MLNISIKVICFKKKRAFDNLKSADKVFKIFSGVYYWVRVQ